VKRARKIKGFIILIQSTTSMEHDSSIGRRKSLFLSHIFHVTNCQGRGESLAFQARKR